MFPISDSPRSKSFPFINIAIILITCYVFFLQLTRPDTFTEVLALIPSRINFSDFRTLYPFVTSIFLHGGLLHILSNMWFLWIFGDNVEGRLGHLSYLLLYLLSGIFGAFAQYILFFNSSIPMLGASGAIAGVLGAYFLFFPGNKIKTLIFVFVFFTIADVSAYVMLGYWFILQLISGAISLPGSEQGGIAFLAHIAGFITGLIIGRLLARTESNVIEGQVV